MRSISLLTSCLLSLSIAGNQTAEQIRERQLHFHFEVYDANTIRPNPTTQIAITVKEWPNNRFLLWLPEDVRGIWNQWTPEVAHQNFCRTAAGGLLWSFVNNKAHVTAGLEQFDDGILVCDVRVTNLSDSTLSNVATQTCFHLSQAPDFICEDFSRILIRTEKQWKRLSELKPKTRLPMYYRPGFLEEGLVDSWAGGFRRFDEKPRADHPMIVCLDKSGKRAVATASKNYQCVFHNQSCEYLRCIHSQEAPVPPKFLPLHRHPLLGNHFLLLT